MWDVREFWDDGEGVNSSDVLLSGGGMGETPKLLFSRNAHLAKGVEVETIDTEDFKVTEQMRSFYEAGGEILACGTCLKIRQSEGSEICPISTMKDLYELVRDSDKVVTF